MGYPKSSISGIERPYELGGHQKPHWMHPNAVSLAGLGGHGHGLAAIC